MTATRIIRKLTDDDFKSFVQVCFDAYPLIKPKSPDEQTKIKENMKKIHNEFSFVNYYGSFEGNKLVGGMIFYDYKMTLFKDTYIDVCGVGMVCVDLLHKRDHVAKEMISFFHDYNYKKNFPMTILYPFRSDFYKKMGYGYGRKLNRYSFEPKQLPSKKKEHLRYLTMDDVEALKKCFNKYAIQRHGMIQKTENRIKAILGRNKVVGYVKETGDIQGFIAFNFKKINEENFIAQNMQINKLIYHNKEVLSELLTFLNHQDDQVNKILFHTNDDDFHWLLFDPRNHGNLSLYQTTQETNITGVGIMYRIINIKKMFSVLKDHNFNDQTISVRFDIKDSFLIENNESIIIGFNNGKASILDSEKYAVTVSMDISEFSSLVMGVINFKKLIKYNLARIDDNKFISTIDKLFRVVDRPITTEEF